MYAEPPPPLLPPSVPPPCSSLQVEQLFCLGVGTRAECLKLLEVCEWSLELASTQLLDSWGSTTTQRY